jgi:hypothetical protein
MKTLHTLTVLVSLGVISYFGYQFYAAYRAATGSRWSRALAATEKSATILWARFVALIGLLTLGLSSLAETLGAPGVSAAIQQYLQPQYVAAVMIGIAVITEVARKRTM